MQPKSSEPTETGMARLALSDTDKQARDWFVETTKALGCTVTIDAMGNTFAVRPGRRNVAPIFAGSHLDTQPAAGRYDGILGVHAGIEVRDKEHSGLGLLQKQQAHTEKVQLAAQDALKPHSSQLNSHFC